LRVDRFGLPNLVLDQDVVPELLQEEVQPDRVEAAARRLWEEGPARDRMLADLARVQEALGGPGVVDRLARVVDFLAAGDSMPQALARTEP